MQALILTEEKNVEIQTLLAHRINEVGLDKVVSEYFGNEKDEFSSAFSNALANYDTVIVSGGSKLAKMISQQLKVPLKASAKAIEHIEAHCKNSGENPLIYKSNVLIPKGSAALLSEKSHIGFFLPFQNKTIVFIPDTPDEYMIHQMCVLLSKMHKPIAKPMKKRRKRTFGAALPITLIFCVLLCLVSFGIYQASLENTDIPAVNTDTNQNSSRDDQAIKEQEDLLKISETNLEDLEKAFQIQTTLSAQKAKYDEQLLEFEKKRAEEAELAAQKAKKEEEARLAAEKAKKEEEARLAAQKAKKEEEERLAAEKLEQERLENELKQQEEDQQNEDYSIDTDEELYATVGGRVVKMNAYDLILQAVQNETHGNMSGEALKAQAVASYTFFRYNNQNGVYPTVGLVSSISNSTQKAVDAVFGEAIYYNNRIINAVYHSTSCGSTTSSKDVWGGHLPYLVSVDSSWDEKAPNYHTAISITADNFYNAVERTYGISLDGDKEDWITIESEADGGYVGTVALSGITTSQGGTVGKGKKITGRNIREQLMGFKLRSHAFTVSYDSSNDKFRFDVYGYGHGVGLSQYGAEFMARDGYSYEEIIEHYYPGVEIK